MDIAIWLLIVLLMLVGMVGAVVPVIPGVLPIYATFFIYGWYFGFEKFGFWFWTIQTLIALMIVISDYIISAYGVKRFGGSKRSITGSLIGIVFGPFVLPAFGIVLGPFLGGMIGELSLGRTFKQSVRAGIGALLGLFSSAVAQILLQLIMIIVFVIWLL